MAVLAAAVLMAGASVAAALNAQAGVPPTPAGWTSIFADDFTGNALSGNWRIDQGTSYPGGPANFGTGEVETRHPARYRWPAGS